MFPTLKTDAVVLSELVLDSETLMIQGILDHLEFQVCKD